VNALSLVALIMFLSPRAARAPTIPVRADAAADVAAVVQALFDGMRAHDADAMAALLHADARIVSTSVENGVPAVQVVGTEGWLNGIRRSTRMLDERTFDPEVRVDGGLASVWTRYEFWVDGTFAHCGVDAFHLARTADGWKIVDIADSESAEGCDPGHRGA
jgi:hypothetical protein